MRVLIIVLMARFFKTLVLLAALFSGLAGAQLPRTVAEGLRAAGIPPSAVGVVVQERGASRPALSFNARQTMNPASVMKLVTTYAALELLGPAFRWKTEVYADGTRRNDVLEGDLVLRGYG